MTLFGVPFVQVGAASGRVGRARPWAGAVRAFCLAAGAAAWMAAPARAAEVFQLQEVPSVAALDVGQMKPQTIYFTDHRTDELADPATGLIRFEDWARARPVQKQHLSLFPGYAEPTVTVTRDGVTKLHKEKLHMYVAEARFVIDKPAQAVDLARYATLEFLEKVDPSIKHRRISSAEVMPLNDPESAHNRNPDRTWCQAPGQVVCIQSRYQLEGKLPIGIRLANKLKEGDHKIADYIEFQSELRVITPQEIEGMGLAELTGVPTEVTGALEQSLFHVNQIMQYGKFLAVLQKHPTDSGKTIATALIALGVETDVLEKRKEYESVPILRNLVPAQVLVGNSSFNTGTSISAGLPDYARHRIKAIAASLEQK